MVGRFKYYNLTCPCKYCRIALIIHNLHGFLNQYNNKKNIKLTLKIQLRNVKYVTQYFVSVNKSQHLIMIASKQVGIFTKQHNKVIKHHLNLGNDGDVLVIISWKKNIEITQIKVSVSLNEKSTIIQYINVKKMSHLPNS